MKVSELMKILSKFSDDADVQIGITKEDEIGREYQDTSDLVVLDAESEPLIVSDLNHTDFGKTKYGNSWFDEETFIPYSVINAE